MKKSLIYFVFVLLGLPMVSYSPVSDYEFIGNLSTEDNQYLSYKLRFSDIGNGKIEGVSITDFYGENSTTSSIVGEINLVEKLISFQELENIDTKSDADAASFCYIRVSNLKITPSGSREVIKGNFRGYFPNGEECVGGSISMIGADVLESLTMHKTKEDSISRMDSTISRLFGFKDSLNRAKILSRHNDLNLEWNSEKVILILWDGYHEDHDRVNIYVNGRLKYKNIEATQKKKRLEFAFKGEDCVIKVHALNNGTSPPNTVNLILLDNEAPTPLQTQLRKDESVIIHLRKK